MYCDIYVTISLKASARIWRLEIMLLVLLVLVKSVFLSVSVCQGTDRRLAGV